MNRYSYERDVFMTKTYTVKNLDCAHCGTKIEQELNRIEGIDSAVLFFAARKLKISGEINSGTLEILNAAARKIESDVEFLPEDEDNIGGEEESLKGDIITLIIGAIIYASAIVCSRLNLEIASTVLYIISYLVLGREIIINTFKNIKSGSIFDENLLMTIATVGAMILGDYSEAVGVVLFFSIGELFEHYAVRQSRNAITAAAALKVDEADILRGEDYVRLNADEIRVGDLIRVKAGERIAADGIVESGSTRVDTSAITGEPTPASLTVGSRAVSGCINLGSVITVRAEAEAKDSTIAGIANAVENAAASKPNIDRFITRFARIYTPIVLAAALAVAIIPSILTGNPSKWIYTALTFLVISCPCAIVLSVPLAYFSGIGAASRLGILFKGGQSLEALAKIKAVAFDKTGTVTNGTFEVTEVMPFGEKNEDTLLSLCAACEEASGHPVAVSIMKYCRERNITFTKAENVSELAGRGISCTIGTDHVLCGNERLMHENGVTVPDNRPVAGSVVYVARNGCAEGRIVVSDTIRKRSAAAVAELKKMGIHTSMLTGDKTENADITRKSVGIDESVGGLMPDEKLNEVRKIRSRYGAVMFVGDGINDGPVLAGADVGAAMHNSSELAHEAADVIFMNSELDSAVRAKKIADKTLRIAAENIVFALLFKLLVIVLGLLGFASMWFAVFADSGVAMLLIFNSIRILNTKQFK